jgi:polysaccharide deacetylase family protein (PEP-CTERM system associated)
LNPPPAPRAAGSPVVNAMSVDVEDYFHVSAFQGTVGREQWPHLESRVERNTERLLAMFDDAGVRATFFVLGWVAEQVPRLVHRIAAAGHEIASHGYGHELLYGLRPETFRDDIRRARAILEDAAGAIVAGYRAPSFSITRRSLWALEVLAEEGYRYDASIYPVLRDRYGIPSAPRHGHAVTCAAGSILEIPGSTLRIGPVNVPIGGGGYFRLMPYAWTRWGIEMLNHREQKPAIFYLHPWEIDPDQPRLPAGLVNRFRHYVGLAQTECRLRRLLAEFRFGPVANVFAGQLMPVPSSLAPIQSGADGAAYA